MRVAVVGASGQVGGVMRTVVAERKGAALNAVQIAEALLPPFG